MTDQPTPQGDGPLSIDQAIGLLTQDNAPEVEDAPVEAAEPEEPEAEPATTGDDAGEPEEAGDSGEVEPEGEAEAEPVDAPQWWDAEAKAKFAALTPELQAIVREQEDKRETIVAKAKQEAAEYRKQADSEVQGVRALAEQLGEFVPQAVETFKSRWDDVDWQAWSQRIQSETDPEAATRDLAAFNSARLAFDEQKAQVEKLQVAQREAEKVAHTAFMREQADELTRIAPELAKNPEMLTTVGKYLVEQGIPADHLATISAKEAVIAHKAWLYDQAQTKAKATVAPAKPKAPPVRTVPSVGSGQAPPANRQASVAKNRFAQTRSIDDAVALLVSRGH
jgi:hypothetical protein